MSATINIDGISYTAQDSNYAYSWRSEGSCALSKSITTRLTFDKDAYKVLKKYQCDPCKKIEVEIKDCGSTCYYFNMADCLFNFCNCTVSVGLKSNDLYSCIDQKQEVNVLELDCPRVKVVKEGLKTVEYLVLSGLDNASGCDLTTYGVAYTVIQPDFTSIVIYAREVCVTNCIAGVAVPPSNDYTLIQNDCALNGTANFARPLTSPIPFNAVYFSGCPSVPPTGSGWVEIRDCAYVLPCGITGTGFSLWLNEEIVANPNTDVEFERGFLFKCMFEEFIKELCPDLEVKSQFFGINCDNCEDCPDNKYYQYAQQYLQNMVVGAKSDFIGSTTDSATRERQTFAEMMLTLECLFNVCWWIEDGVFRLEHRSCEPKTGDLQLDCEFCEVKFNDDALVKFLKFIIEDEDYSTRDFGVHYLYFGDCGKDGKECELESTTDIDWLYGSDLDTSDTGMVFLATEPITQPDLSICYTIISGVGETTGQNINNAPLSWGNLITCLHTYGQGQCVGYLTTSLKQIELKIENGEFTPLQIEDCGDILETTLTCDTCCPEIVGNKICHPQLGCGKILSATLSETGELEVKSLFKC